MTLAVVVVLAAVVAIGAVAAILWRRTVRRPVAVPEAGTGDWTDAAGHEFGGLSEPARCEMIFAIAALNDPRSLPVLERALADPSETVALAAARALAGHGGGAMVERYFAANPGERAARIAGTLAIMGGSKAASSPSS